MMRHPRLAFASSVVSFLALTGTALAQEPAPAPAEPAATPPEAAPPAAPPEATPVAETAEAPAPAAAPEAAPAAEEPASIPGWFRIDSDGVGLQLWAGATHDVGGLALATDMYVTAGAGGLSIGEFDIGPAFALADGAVVITPMVGLAWSWMEKRTATLVPQLYAVGGSGPLYFEVWFQMFLNSVFTEGAANSLYNRTFLTYNFVEDFGIGPAIEPTFGLNADQDGITSFPVGGIAKLNYGPGATFFGFLGYETKKDARLAALGDNDQSGDRGLVGRLTFVKNW